MKILLVLDQFDNDNNGTTVSAKRFAQTLKDHNNEVRVVSIGEPREGKYTVGELWLPPVVNRIVKNQGMAFAQPDEAVLRQAIAWADVVHFLMPFFISRKGLKIARELGVPHTAAFHVQPENISYNIKLGKIDSINSFIYHLFRDSFYNYFTHVHCPSHFIAGELKRNGYTAKLHVISNGVDSSFRYRKLPKSDALKGKFVILMIGRLSNEKRQDVLIEAVRRSKYADRIQLVLAGQGPHRRSYLKAGQALPNGIIIDFYSKDRLQELLAMCDLYVHAADIEIEAISCIEAFCSGLVPVIANSPKSATPQFAQDERSLFTAGDSSNLAEKIDYWIEHEEERLRMEKVYSEYGKQFNIDNCVNRIEEMFEEAIGEQELE